ncbi:MULTISPECIES: glycosyltransferase family 2 protein [Gordonia]|jgi:GT2 family glycosyltransferase|uniref:Glycosyl transferase n=2 Tax=Gordonia alkanivorans TaxID=84096 RepID=W9DID3_9ACTN|nr:MULTISPECIES: glycosyltransferase [Gordonia]ETA06256.1 glycosyl transferase [Gordonia alkanivorans CGMCC 6845]MDH3013575.1 glycosyltransferase [Gordonia alkanivorans]MDH3022333.1 glycosyltransferase [Gordonia alkanivorans]MDH3026388.1 glycosyltransferase [Gordonia alkanivorans]MDH3047966.1 glycosyltransferase [Gordonia alkanivorans]
MTVVAVIPTFEPTRELVDSVANVLRQVDSVIVVDDGSPSLTTDPRGAVRTVLDDCAAAGATVLESGSNQGIAHALNQGVREALSRDADAVLTLDQDTSLEPDYVRRAVDHLELAKSLGLSDVMASPAYINDDVAPFWFAVEGLTLAFEPLQSGLLVTRSLFEKIGLFDESLFIDCVETEFYLRARAAGGHALIVPGNRIRHRLGRAATWTPPRPLRWLLRGRGAGAAVEFTEDAPFRHYYIARNRAVLYRRYSRTEPLWSAASVAKDVIARGRAMLIGTDRPARVYLTCAGLRAAAAGETGRIPDRTLGRAHGLTGGDRENEVEKPRVTERCEDVERPLPELVSVVISALDCVDVIDIQLEALAAQTYERPFEVIIADNGSTDGLREHVEHHSLRERLRMRWVDASAVRGISYARNAGVASADGDFIALCDADDRVYPEWLTELTAVATRHSAVGGGLETHSLNSPEVQSWRQMLPADEPYALQGFLQVHPTCNVGVWRDVYERVGGFDVDYVNAAEDSDFLIRVQLSGGTLGLAPKALVAYRLRDTLAGLWRQSVTCGMGTVQLYSDYRHYGMPRWPWYVTLDMFLFILIRNPLLPTVITRVPTGRWLFTAGNFLGRIKGSIKYRCYYG